MFYGDNEIDELKNCPHCIKEYQDPRILPCGQTLCLECIENEIENKEFECHNCLSTHQIPSSGFPQNLML
jgi:hypothetical protein